MGHVNVLSLTAHVSNLVLGLGAHPMTGYCFVCSAWRIRLGHRQRTMYIVMYVNEVPAVKQMNEKDFVLLSSCFLPLGKGTHFRKHRYQMSSSRFH